MIRVVLLTCSAVATTLGLYLHSPGAVTAGMVAVAIGFAPWRSSDRPLSEPDNGRHRASVAREITTVAQERTEL